MTTPAYPLQVCVSDAILSVRRVTPPPFRVTSKREAREKRDFRTFESKRLARADET